jgi:hypothetical protein
MKILALGPLTEKQAYHKERYQRDKERIKERSRQWHAANKFEANEKRWFRHVRRYNITPEQYMLMHAAQAGKCAICKLPEKDNKHLAVDHCHRTNRVRGLLCQKCNTGIGLLGESQEIFLRAATYLGGAS